MTPKAIYRHKRTGDLFAIETDVNGSIVASSGPLLFKDLDPEKLDYDDFWNHDIKVHLKEFELLSEAEYKELLFNNGFSIQSTQRSLFDELDRRRQ